MEHEQTLREILREYSAWTSTHGIAHIVLTENPLLRAIWAVLTLGAFSAAIYQVVTLFIRYFSYSVIIQPNTEFTPLIFPIVTFCNMNPWKMSNIAGTPLQRLVDSFERRHHLPAFNTHLLLDHTREWMWLMGETLIYRAHASQFNKNKSDIAYRWEELFVSCIYNGKACAASDFTEFYNVHHGRCFQFNTLGLLKSTRAGPSRGLRVVLRSDQAEYLPWMTSAGMAIGITTFGRPVFMDAFGHFAPVGEATAFALEYLRRTKLDAPFSNCTFMSDNLKQPIYYNSIYTAESCIRSCLQDKIIADCGCYSPRFNIPFNTIAPSCFNVQNPNKAIACSKSFIHQASKSAWNVYDDCACPFACDESTYIITASNTKWPADSYVPPECSTLSPASLVPGSPVDVRITRSNSRWSSMEECLKFYKENTLKLDIYFSTITMQTQEEDQGYKIINFIADAGGATGLWLGMSIVSVIEALLFLCVLIRFLIFRPKAVRIDPTYDYFATFKNLERFDNPALYRADIQMALQSMARETR